MNYDNIDELKLRVINCVLKYDKDPVLCETVYYDENVPEDFEKFNLKITNLVDKKKKIVSQIDPLIETKIKLGYVNYDNQAVYVNRMPTRRYRAGLHQENMSIHIHEKATMTTPSWPRVVASTGFLETFKGAFPKLEETEFILRDKKFTNVQGIESLYESVAFGRTLAVFFDQFRKDYILLHRNNPIGFGSPKTGFTITEDYRYLLEALDEKGVKCKT